MVDLGVFPVNQTVFKIGTKGKGSVEADMAIVKDMETLGISVDNGIEEWNPLDQEGWKNRLMTAKSMTISLTGKRHWGDKGNDYVASLAFANGKEATTILKIEFPNGDTLKMNCVVNVTASAGGDSTSVAALEFECLSNGKPIYTEAI